MQTIKEETITTFDYNDKQYRILGYFIIIVIFILFGSWSYLAKLESAVSAPAKIKVESFRKKIQHLEGGIVKKIHINEGDFVTKSQILLTLDNTHVKAKLEVLRSNLYVLEAKRARLIAERDNLSTIPFKLDIDNQLSDIHKRQQQIFDINLSSRNGERKIIEYKILQLKSSMNGLNALIKSKNKRISSYNDEINIFRKLIKEGFTNKQQIRELERNLSLIEGEVAENLSQIRTTNVQISENQLQILQLDKSTKFETINQLDEIQNSIFELQESLKSSKDILARTNVYAPVSGKVLGLSIHTIGGVISPGTVILDIVPKADKLILEAKVQPSDINRINLTQEVELRFSTLKKSSTIISYGVIESISADSITDDTTGEYYYIVRININNNSLIELNNLGLSLLPGMPAEVLIKTGKQTFFEYIIQPITDLLANSFIEE